MRALLCAAVFTSSFVLAAEPDYCGETPTKGIARSVGKPAAGSIIGAERLSSEVVDVLPERHAKRCLDWGVPRLLQALDRASRSVIATAAKSPHLRIGDISRAKGGPILAYSHSHQAGRDVDLAFYALESNGEPADVRDLTRFRDDGTGPGGTRFDARRNWLLVQALLEDPTIDVQWIFVSKGLRSLLLDEARRQKASKSLRERAEEILHQPSDAPPHDDHLHLRIRCTAGERAQGCIG